MKELVPTGKLRVAIAISPTPSAFYAVKDGATGKFRGVTVDLGTALAKKLGVPVEFLPHLASGEIQNTAASGRWDVTFMPVDDERKKILDFGSPYHLLQSTYLVAPGATPMKVEDANAAGVASAASPTPRLSAPRSAPRPRPHSSACRGRRRHRRHECERDRRHRAVARTSPAGAENSGSRILDGGILNSSTAVAGTKGKPKALRYVSQFVEEAKASGLVRKSLDAMNLKNS